MKKSWDKNSIHKFIIFINDFYSFHLSTFNGFNMNLGIWALVIYYRSSCAEDHMTKPFPEMMGYQQQDSQSALIEKLFHVCT